MKKCPFCAEEIQDDAIKCRFCNEIVVQPPKKEPWYCNSASIIMGFIVAGPLVLPLVWINPRFSRVTKIVITVIMLGITWFLGKVFLDALGSLNKYYDLISGKY